MDEAPNQDGAFLSPSENLDGVASTSPTSPPNLNTLRSASDTPIMTPSSTPLGHINAARRPGPLPNRNVKSSGLTEDIQAKMKAFSLSRQGVPPSFSNHSSPDGNTNDAFGGIAGSVSPPQGALAGGANQGVITGSPAISGRLPGGMTSMKLPQQSSRPQPPTWSSAPPGAGSVKAPTPKMGGLAAKRGLAGGMKLSNAGTSSSSSFGSSRDSNTDAASGGTTDSPAKPQSSVTDSAFSKYSDLIDTKSGSINFKNKAIIHSGGIDFSSGRSFNISLDEVQTLEELGKGNYGTVYRVRHSRPRIRKPGLGLKGAMSLANNVQHENQPPSDITNELSNIIMAMKEIRLELDESKFTAIIMELDILHRCVSPFIIDFYGAFFQEGAVYICVEFMDGGSMEKLYEHGVPENILRKITMSTIMGLKSLKDEHNIIHRDVKPTNILINTRGQIKICDFGVSGNLVASIAKTNIGCQSYMAPERISGGGHASGPTSGTYSVQSDVWSLGLTIVECAMGRYPYPPETYNNIFSQLNAIVQGDPPTLPEDGYSDKAKDFVKSCLNKNANLRPTYAMLIRHPWLVSLMERPADDNESFDSENHDTSDEEVAAWVLAAIDRRKRDTMGITERPALHAVALDAVPGSPLLEDPSSISPSSASSQDPLS